MSSSLLFSLVVFDLPIQGDCTEATDIWNIQFRNLLQVVNHYQVVGRIFSIGGKDL